MAEADLVNLILIPIGLGLLGFVEPCSIGSSLLFIKFVEGRSVAVKLSQVGVFMATRALFIGALGAGAGLFGALFLNVQKGGWLALGTAYLVLGVLFLVGKGAVLSRTVGLGLTRLSGLRGGGALGVLFGLNIPACAAPLVFALLGAAAVGTGANAGKGFVTLALFGLALSLPLVAALVWAPARRLLDRFASLSARVPLWTGIVFVALGLWSIYFGLFVRLEDWV